MRSTTDFIIKCKRRHASLPCSNTDSIWHLGKSVSNAAWVGGCGCRCTILSDGGCVCAKAGEERSADRCRRVCCIAHGCAVRCTKPVRPSGPSSQGFAARKKPKNAGSVLGICTADLKPALIMQHPAPMAACQVHEHTALQSSFLQHGLSNSVQCHTMQDVGNRSS